MSPSAAIGNIGKLVGEKAKLHPASLTFISNSTHVGHLRHDTLLSLAFKLESSSRGEHTTLLIHFSTL